MVLAVEFLGERGLAERPGDVTDGRRERLLLQAGEDLLPDRLVAEVHMVEVSRWRRPDEPPRGARPSGRVAEAFRAPARARRLRGEGAEHIRVKGVALPEFTDSGRPASGERRSPAVLHSDR